MNSAPVHKDAAFPALEERERNNLQEFATIERYGDGLPIFRAGDADIDLFVIESGAMEIRNPRDGHRVVAVHEPGDFSGDVDLLTGRPVIVEGFAKGATVVRLQ